MSTLAAHLILLSACALFFFGDYAAATAAIGLAIFWQLDRLIERTRP